MKAKPATRFQLPVDETNAVVTFEFEGNDPVVDALLNSINETPSDTDWIHIGTDYDYFGVPDDEMFVYAIANGEVYDVGLDDGSGTGHGNYVIIKHTLPGPDAKEIYSFYAHMANAPLVKKDDPVDIGDSLGLVGNTGAVTAAHLHFGMRSEPKFTSGGPGSGSYDTQTQFDQGVESGFLFDPDAFVREVDSGGPPPWAPGASDTVPPVSPPANSPVAADQTIMFVIDNSGMLA